MPRQQWRKLEEWLAGGTAEPCPSLELLAAWLDAFPMRQPTRRWIATHLEICPRCRWLVTEARLALLVLSRGTRPASRRH